MSLGKPLPKEHMQHEFIEMTIKEHTIIGQANTDCSVVLFEKEPTDAKSLVEYVIYMGYMMNIHAHTHTHTWTGFSTAHTRKSVHLVVRQVDVDFLFE